MNETLRRPTLAEIDLNKLEKNFLAAKDFIGSDLKYMAVVKANAYGHGSVKCALKLQQAGIDWFAVALPEEGLELRRAGITKLILVLGGFWPGQEEIILNNRLTPVIYNIEQANLLNETAASRGTIANIHIKIDTGMGRVGVRFEIAAMFAQQLAELKNLSVEGMMTHLAAADDPSEGDFTRLQINRFYEAVETFREHGFSPVYLDLANSSGSIAYPESRGNMVRLGGILYGLTRDTLPSELAAPEFEPVMSLHTEITHLKSVASGERIGYGGTYTTDDEAIIATIPIGYEDGYRRALSNNSRAIVNGVYVPVIGRVSMDWTILDVSAVPGVKLGDRVTLIGEDRDAQITAAELAERASTISYEITCGIDARVPRIYISE